MKQYIPVIVVAVVTFGICFLVDWLLKRRKKNQVPQNKVRPQRRTLVFGLVLSFLALSIGLGYMEQGALIVVGCCVIFLMGVLLLYIYGATSIVYDDEGFTDKAPFRKARRFSYGDITGEMAVMARSGVNAMLYVGKNEVHLYQSMAGVQDFLKTAYHGWLAQTGRTEDECPPPNPMYLVWFPEPDEAKQD